MEGCTVRSIALLLDQPLEIEAELVVGALLAAGDDPDVLGEAEPYGTQQDEDDDRQTGAPALLHRDSPSCGMWTSDRRALRSED